MGRSVEVWPPNMLFRVPGNELITNNTKVVSGRLVVNVRVAGRMYVTQKPTTVKYH